MRYVDEYRDAALVREIAARIRERVSHAPRGGDMPPRGENMPPRGEHAGQAYTFMEVCGSHTMAVHRFGLHSLLPESVRLISGPGCPVCVTDQSYINRAVAYARRPDVIVATYGDLLRVPGSSSSLEAERAGGAEVRLVYSSLEVLDIAEAQPQKKVIFLGLGFETTAPTSAAAVTEARRRGLRNFFLYSAHKRMPPAMEALAGEDLGLEGYLCPGHVSTVTGTEMYRPLAERYGLSCVVSGFEPVDIMQSLYMLVVQREEGRAEVENEYARVVSREGNRKAQELMAQVFAPRRELWRGLGSLDDSGLALRDEYSEFDAEKQVEAEPEETRYEPGCICGAVLKGLKTPLECELFARTCTPANPVGACMVSSEGACAAFYRYRRREVKN